MKMRYLKSIVMVAFLSLAAILVLDSCSSSKKTTTRKGDASIATNAPDYKRIKKEINTKGSEFYYPELLRRFEAADTTLTAEQIHYFYYGTATRPEFDPFQSEHVAYALLKEELKGDTLTEENWKQAAEIVEKYLDEDPTNLGFHIYKQNVYFELYGEESEEAYNAYIQVVMLYSAIASTGDGKSQETAFHVICVSDEYALMRMFGFSPKSQALLEKKGRSYDRMDLEENEYGLEALYFDITVSFEAMNKMFGH